MAAAPSEPGRWQRLHNGRGQTVWVGSKIELANRIYRYMPWERVLQFYVDSQLRFASPRTWKDPYEKWWCDQLFKPGTKLEGAQAFASCWTRSSRDEPYWRMYDHGGAVPVVRLGTTVGKLVEALHDHVKKSSGNSFISRVKYKPVEALRHAARTKLVGAGTQIPRTVANALLWKRTAFRMENEVRAILVDRHGDARERFLTVDPRTFITSVMLAPSIGEHRADEIRALLLKLGVPAGKVRHSSIYKPPAD